MSHVVYSTKMLHETTINLLPESEIPESELAGKPSLPQPERPGFWFLMTIAARSLQSLARSPRSKSKRTVR